MTLSPDDIVGYEFKQSLRGYAVDEVDDLLDRLADQVERTDRELDDARQRLRETEARLASTLETESTLKRTLVTAQQAAEQAMADAREQADELRQATEREAAERLEHSRAEADQTLADARAEAERILADASTEAEQALSQARADARTEIHDATQRRAAIEQRIEALEDLEHRHRALLERHLRDHLQQLEHLGRDSGEIAAERPDGEAPELTIRVHSDDELPETPTFGEPVHDEVAANPAVGDSAVVDEEPGELEELRDPPEPWRDREPTHEGPAEPWRDDTPTHDEPTQAGDTSGDEGEDEEPTSPEPRSYEIPESPDQDLWAWSKPGPPGEESQAPERPDH